MSGSFSPGFSSPELDEMDPVSKRTSVLRKSKRPTLQRSSKFSQFARVQLLTCVASDLKERISSPFDFQHLTHTDRHQFASIHDASERELVVEFSAVRASQAPRRDLTGIKAEDLHSERLATPDSRPTSRSAFRSPPMSPNAQDQQESSTSSEEPLGPALRLSRSVESFSRPGVNPRTHRHTQSANPPPRISSRPSQEAIQETSTDTDVEPRMFSPNTRRQSGFWEKFPPLSPDSTGGPLATMVEESDYVGHAFSTPDNTACHPMTPPFSPGLEDVAEEPERFVDPRPAPLPPSRAQKSPRSPTFESFSFSRPRSPIAKSQYRRSPHTSPKATNQRTSITRPISQMSDTLASPGVNRRCSIRRAPTMRRKSNTWRVIEESWEDDIDYIYDNALEADCDFDWDRASVDAFEDRDRTPEQQDHKRVSTADSQDTHMSSLHADDESASRNSFYSEEMPSSLYVPSVSSVPELESRSAISSSTADTSIKTPSDLYMPSRQYPFMEAEGLPLTPSLLLPQDFKEQVAREDMYADLLAHYEDSDAQYPFLEPTQSVSSSTRSSHVRSSKRSSYDSSLTSSGQGSGSWTSGTRRSASSAGSHGSLPELVHSSRHARRDFTTMVDRLSEQVASFAAFDEDREDDEDDETTPPGHASKDRTFFASDDEQSQTHEDHPSVEAEVRSSLELARRGSTRSTRGLIHHKYASSDGAAKLLSSAPQSAPERQSSTKSRSRAASSSVAQRKNREQYLSLFPSPPTHSPLASPALSADRTFNRL